MPDPWRILVVDDEEPIAGMTAELLNNQSGVNIRATCTRHFEESLLIIAEGKVDILVLDVRNQSVSAAMAPTDGDMNPGLDIFSEIRSQRFLPIIFYTALPELVQSLSNPPFVQTVPKIDNDDVTELRSAVSMIIDSGLLDIIRVLDRHVKIVTRDFMGGFVEENWAAFEGHEADLAHLLLRRLSVSLEEGAESFAYELGYPLGSGYGEGDLVYATRYYIVPPIEAYRMGDIVRGLRNIYGAVDTLHIILTPSCDLVQGRVKADNVVLAECVPIQDFQEYQNWMREDTRATRTKLSKLLRSRPDRGQEDRYHYLPAAWQIPNLIVDLQRIVHISYDMLEECTKVASLDSPFSEALSNRFTRYMGRVGTPDLNLEAALDRMREAD